VKLGNFSHAALLQDSFDKWPTIGNLLTESDYKSPVNCIMQKYNRESPLYFAPEKWENPDLSTFSTDCFSVGLCIFLLNNQLICSEEQLALKLLSIPLGSTKICLDISP